MTRKTAAGLVLAVLLPLVVILYPGDIGAVPRLALALSLATIVLWTFEPVPLEYSSLLLIVLFPILDVLPFETAFRALFQQNRLAHFRRHGSEPGHY